MPLRSDDADAAVGEVFATVLVLVSEMWILCNGMPKLRAATCDKNKKNKRKENISVARIERKHLFVYGYIPLHWSWLFDSPEGCLLTCTIFVCSPCPISVPP